MAYLNTNSVKVFPSARRVMTDVSSRLMSEKSLARLTNMLIDTDGFIITKPEDILDQDDKLDTSQPIEFNIFGYYFRVEKIIDLINSISKLSGDNLFVSIELVQVGDYIELYGQDETEETGQFYRGLNVTTTVPTPAHGGKVHYLQLFTKPVGGTDWSLIYNSYFKFNRESLNIDIDGGEVI